MYMKSNKPQCSNCKSDLEERKTALTFQMGDDKIIVVKSVPSLICEECGEESVDVKDSEKVEKLVHKAIADGITMGFVDYNSAA